MQQNQDSSGAAIVRRAFELFGEGNLAASTELFASDAVWHFPGSSPFSGDHVGREAIRAFLLKFPTLSGPTYHPMLVDLAEGEKYVVFVQRTQLERNGRSGDFMSCHLFEVGEGLIREVSTYPYDLRALEAFWA